ncbi:MAG: oligoribonuclease [Deltaproteobacteria bacterium]|nr:oligoribonuclease [Deltaproteobacteria bacterium]
MTGLDIERHVILEIASIVTDNNLDIVAQGPDIAISHPEHILSLIEEWSREHHQASGLMDRVKSSSYTTQSAEEETLDFLSRYCEKDESPLCGNSVWQDRRFLNKYMPRLEAFPHYRNIDVSSVKELVKRWYPELAPFEKDKAHLAMSDIRESIKELIYYRRNVFIA